MGVTVSEELENVDRADEEPVTSRRLSRRAVIAGTAGTAAAMWAAPAVTSLGSRAFAQSPLCAGQTVPCVNGIPDYSHAHPCSSGPALGPAACYCVKDVDGSYFCAQFVSQIQCSSDKDCTSVVPSRCADVCGDQYCAPLCGTEPV